MNSLDNLQIDQSQFDLSDKLPAKILLAGCGDLGIRTAARLDTGYFCYGLRRESARLPNYIRPLKADLTNFDQMKDVMEIGFQIIIVTITPDAYNECAYRSAYLASAETLVRVINESRKPPSLVVWTSSTSVYGQKSGEWVDELSPVSPQNYNGQILLEAENMIKKLPCSKVVLRFSGIYGPGRHNLLDQVLAGEESRRSLSQWTNRIHSDDCAGIFCHLMDLHLRGQTLHELYLATDCEPVKQYALRQWLSSNLNVKLNEAATSTESGRRYRNERLLGSEFKFLFPSYKQGYCEIIRNFKQP
ncbi:MAG: hypothetical protein CBD08_002145 [Cellvibrionales bacterium TMED148]|nr:hypothetical protein [Porticoccaceae bacterium]RPG92615.1 MAG: hypothetical protein CBD08_002145 [Cellvibrionales bacterium TMED148]